MIKRAIRLVWGVQPRFLRRLELDVLELCVTRPLPQDRKAARGDAIVCGLIGTASGIGRGARQMLELFRESKLPVHSANASRFAILEDFDAGPFWPAGAQEGGVAIFHINPDILSLVWNAIGRKRLLHRRIIAVWIWELETPPKRWRRAVKLVDEIWAPSQFAATAMRKIAVGKPVHVLPYVFDILATRTVPAKDPLPTLTGKTIVFFAYDVRSVHARKNPEAVVAAFRSAAAENPNAALVIKINNNAAWPEASTRVQKAAEGLSNVVLMHDKLSDDEMQDLFARVDIVISLHRSEGFGMLMASAMAAAKPVIATGWSGNLDFMTQDCSVLVGYKLTPVVDPQHVYDQFDAHWAEPDVKQAAEALRRLLADPEERRRMGQAARAHVEKFFSKEAWIQTVPNSFWDSIEAEADRS